MKLPSLIRTGLIRTGLIRTGLLAAVATALTAMPAAAGQFDCSVAYDEFDSFMNRNYLSKPEQYGQVLQGKITRDHFEQNQKGRLLLRAGREGMGVAIVHTNAGAHGKLLFSWGGRGDAQGTPLLVLRDITLYGNVENGTGLVMMQEMRMTASQGIDLDAGRASTGPEADIVYRNPDGRTLTLEPVNGASLIFPMETLCTR